MYICTNWNMKLNTDSRLPQSLWTPVLPNLGWGAVFLSSKKETYWVSLDIAALGPTFIFLKKEPELGFSFLLLSTFGTRSLIWVHIKYLKLPGLPHAKPISRAVCKGPELIHQDCCLVTKLCLTLWSHELQHTRLLCPLWSLKVCSNLCPLSQWCHWMDKGSN